MIYRFFILLIFISVSFADVTSSDIERLNKDIFSATEDNYKDLKIYFTEAAWINFSNQLKESGNLSLIKKNNMSTTVSFLGIVDNQFTEDKYIISSKIMVTYHNEKIYQTNEYLVTIQFTDDDHHYKISSLDVVSLAKPLVGKMTPDCPLK